MLKSEADAEYEHVWEPIRSKIPHNRKVRDIQHWMVVVQQMQQRNVNVFPERIAPIHIQVNDVFAARHTDFKRRESATEGSQEGGQDTRGNEAGIVHATMAVRDLYVMEPTRQYKTSIIPLILPPQYDLRRNKEARTTDGASRKTSWKNCDFLDT